MMVFLQGVLTQEDVARVQAELAAADWRDGKATAGPSARPVKENLQARDVSALEEFVLAALRRHPVFTPASRPRRISRLLFSRYEPGMAYGPHTDDALMGDSEPLRTDVAFTLFLSDPATYEGGVLLVDSPAGEQAVKLAAGDAVLYPAGTIHRVEPVVGGARLAAVGWVQSFVRDAHRREILFDLATARARVAPNAAREDVLLLDKAVSNLLRLWAE